MAIVTNTYKTPTLPDFVIRRREILRASALKEAAKALKAVEAAGGQAVVFGSVLRPGAFSEDSDIDICLIKPSTFSEENVPFYTLVDTAINGFEADISWYDDLLPVVRSVIEKEGLSAADVC